MNEKIPIIIDTDIGSDVDDLAALTYTLLKKDVLDIKAISTVYGKTKLRSAIVEKVLSSIGSNSIPVFSGIGIPLTQGVNIWETGQEGLGIIDIDLIDQIDNSNPGDLSDLHRFISEIPSGITILALGPLTNIAFLLKNYPSLKNTINSIIIMGGNFGLTTDAGSLIEHNFKSDPKAVDIVLKSGIATTILGIDITHGAIINQTDVDKLKKSNKKIISILTKEIEKWFRYCREYFNASENMSYLHDPLTIAYLSNPEFFKTRKIFCRCYR